MRDELLQPEPMEPSELSDEVGLRPRSLADFVGQAELKEHLSIILEAARNCPTDAIVVEDKETGEKLVPEG